MTMKITNPRTKEDIVYLITDIHNIPICIVSNPNIANDYINTVKHAKYMEPFSVINDDTY